MRTLSLLFSLVSVFTVLGASHAADEVVLRFKEHPVAAGNVVRLGELVDLISGQSPSINKLMTLTLGPAPRENSSQNWQSSEVLKHLELRGVHPASIRWSGRTEARLDRIAKLDSASTENMVPAFLQERTVLQAESLVARAIAEYVTFKTGERTDWNIEVSLPSRYVPVLQTKRNIISVGGGKDPWLGKQEFVLQIKEGRNSSSINSSSIKVQATVSLPPMVVTAYRPMRRDELIQASALTLKPLPKKTIGRDAQYFTSIEEVVGMQLRRSISTGMPIVESYIGEPILIARNALVQLESVAGSVVVSTQAKSLGSGARGELIEVEILGVRQRLHATVVDALTVRIAAQPKQAAR